MITFVPVGGLANRMRAIDSAIALAQDTHHDLRIIWFKDQGLNCRFCDLFQPIPLLGVTVKEADWTDYLLHDRPRRKNLYIPAAFLNIQYDGHIYEKEVTDLFYQQFDFKQWAQQHKNLWMASYIYFYPISEESKRYQIFHPISQLQHEIEKRCASFNLQTKGVHIRRTDHTDAINQSPTELFINRIKQCIATDENSLFYLATDSEEEKRRLVELFGKHIQTSPYKANRNTTEGIQEGLVELYTLSRTQTIFGSSNSSYTEAAATLGNITNEVIMRNDVAESDEYPQIHIALATDNNYIIPTTVALKSIFQHHPNVRISVYLCHVQNQLKKDFIDFFVQFAAKHNAHLHPIEISQEQLANLPETRHGKAALLRLCLPKLLPQLKKILYLDGDVIVQSDLTELYNTDLGENYIAAVKDTLPIYHPQRVKSLGINEKHWYFNTGVLLLNLEKLRQINLVEDIKAYAQKHYHEIALPDQDVLNYICQGHTCYIHPRYNMNYAVEKDVAQSTWGKKEIQEAKESPAIIHFVGPIKPWSILCVHPKRKQWWKVLRQTPFQRYQPKDASLKNRLKRCYLLVYWKVDSWFTLSAKQEIGKMIPETLKRKFKRSVMKKVS